MVGTKSINPIEKLRQLSKMGVNPLILKYKLMGWVIIEGDNVRPCKKEDVIKYLEELK